MEEDLATARAMGYCYGAKIVRGAYMDQERRLARQHRYEGEGMQHLCASAVCQCVCSISGLCSADPVHPTKEETDRSYHDVVRLALRDAGEGRAWITVATHNPDSVQMAQKM